MTINVVFNTLTCLLTECLCVFQGIVDFKKEVEKLKTKREKADQQLNKLIQSTEMEDYVTKVCTIQYFLI